MAYRVTMTPFAFVFLLLIFAHGSWVKVANGQRTTWCVAKPSSEEYVLQKNIDYACANGVDCSVISPGQACSLPDTRINHASVVMNRYYSANGKQPFNCDFGNSGLITIVDPSYGSCVYT